MKKIVSFLSLSKLSFGQLILYLAVIFITALINLALPEILRQASDAITNKNLGALKPLTFAAIVITVLYTIFDAINKVLGATTVNNYQARLQLLVLEKYLSIKKVYVSRFKTGDIVTHIINNSSDAVSSSIYYLTSSFMGYTTVTLSLLYMFYVEWRITLVVIAFNICSRMFIHYFEKKYKVINKKSISIIKSNNSFIIDLLSNMLTIKVFNQGDYVTDKLKEKETHTMKINTVLNAWRSGFTDGVWAIVKMCEFVVVYGFGGYLIYKGYTVIGTLIAFTFALDYLSQGINSITSSLTSKGTAHANIESVEEVLNMDFTNLECEKEEPINGTLITFEHVSFAYDEGQANILNNVSFTINEKDKVMIKGKNGMGKSTLLNLISGLYRPTAGTIYYGDADTSATHIHSLSQNYAYISQTSNILEGDIYENISLTFDYDKELCDHILQKLNLEKIKGTEPALLSQGEKQRLNIGRSLYKLKKGEVNIVLADEIFSNVDKENTGNIASMLNEEFEDKTVIMVCHEDVPYPFNKVIEVSPGQVIVKDLKAGAAV